MEIFINKKLYFAFVDLGFDDDLSVETRVKKNSDGSIDVLPNRIIVRSSEID